MTPLFESFVARASLGYADGYAAFALEMMRRGMTPLFEWCDSRRAAGVLSHASDSLTLLAIRDNRTGAYLGRKAVEHCAAVHGVPVVEALGSPLEFLRSRV